MRFGSIIRISVAAVAVTSIIVSLVISRKYIRSTVQKSGEYSDLPLLKRTDEEEETKTSSEIASDSAKEFIDSGPTQSERQIFKMQQNVKKNVRPLKVVKRQNVADENEKPLNILLLYADDWRYDTLGAASNNSVIKTPFLDTLAKQGVRFSQNCVTTSVCWISRATLNTGQYYSRHKQRLIAPPVFYYEYWNETYPGEFLIRNKCTNHIKIITYHPSYTIYLCFFRSTS
jgi:hypothetical protein